MPPPSVPADPRDDAGLASHDPAELDGAKTRLLFDTGAYVDALSPAEKLDAGVTRRFAATGLAP